MKKKNQKCECCHRVNPDPSGKAAAMAEARTALKKMRNPGWTIRLWHNVNWNWSLKNLYIQIMPSGDSFWAQMSDSLTTGGSPMYWSPAHKNFRDPNAAALYVLRAADRFYEGLTEILGDQHDALCRDFDD